MPKPSGPDPGQTGHKIRIWGAGNVVGNANTTIHVHVSKLAKEDSDSKELAHLLQRLLVAFEAERDLISEPEQVLASIEYMAQALAATEARSRLTLRGILDGITTSAAAAIGVCRAAEELRQAIERRQR